MVLPLKRLLGRPRAVTAPRFFPSVFSFATRLPPVEELGAPRLPCIPSGRDRDFFFLALGLPASDNTSKLLLPTELPSLGNLLYIGQFRSLSYGTPPFFSVLRTTRVHGVMRKKDTPILL